MDILDDDPGMDGTATWLGSEWEGHMFFLGKPGCENAKQLMDSSWTGAWCLMEFSLLAEQQKIY
jgi:hypothetical protein